MVFSCITGTAVVKRSLSRIPVADETGDMDENT